MYYFFLCLDLSDRMFIQRYRLSKQLARRVITLITPYMNVPTTLGGLTIDRKVSTYEQLKS